MKVLRVILGILVIMCACSILTFPAFAAVAICWVIPLFMFISGIFAIIGYIEDKNAEKVARKAGKAYLGSGIGSLIFGIAGIVIYLVVRNSDTGIVTFTKIIAVLFGIWIVLFGISFIFLGSQGKKVAAPGWLAMIVIGVLFALMGVFCFVNAFVALNTMGTLFAVSMMMSGFGLIFGE